VNWIKKEFEDEPVFNKGDGTPEKRTHAIANSM